MSRSARIAAGRILAITGASWGIGSALSGIEWLMVVSSVILLIGVRLTWDT